MVHKLGRSLFLIATIVTIPLLLLQAVWLALQSTPLTLAIIVATTLLGMIDHRGYDILVESRGILRHIQLKSTRKGGRASNQKIHLSLADKPSGCVVWTVFDEEALDIDHYLFLGGAPGEKLPPLGDRVAKHTKGNADGEKLERPMLREVPKRNFKKIETFDELYDTLFCNC